MQLLRANVGAIRANDLPRQANQSGQAGWQSRQLADRPGQCRTPDRYLQVRRLGFDSLRVRQRTNGAWCICGSLTRR